MPSSPGTQRGSEMMWRWRLSGAGFGSCSLSPACSGSPQLLWAVREPGERVQREGGVEERVGGGDRDHRGSKGKVHDNQCMYMYMYSRTVHVPVCFCAKTIYTAIVRVCRHSHALNIRVWYCTRSRIDINVHACTCTLYMYVHVHCT